MTDTKEKLKKILKSYSKESQIIENLNEETKLSSNLQIHSARMVDLALAIEDEFDIDLPDEELSKLENIGALVKYIQNQI